MKHPRKLRNFLLVPKIQLKYVYYLLALVVAPISVLLLYTVIQFQKLRYQFELLNSIPTETLDRLSSVFLQISFGVVFTLLFLVATVFYGTIVLSHRFVGPIYVINKYLEAMLKGQYLTARELRKDDEMHDTFVLLKKLGEQLNKK